MGCFETGSIQLALSLAFRQLLTKMPLPLVNTFDNRSNTRGYHPVFYAHAWRTQATIGGNCSLAKKQHRKT